MHERAYFAFGASDGTPLGSADDLAMEAGRKIHDGDRTREILKIIFHWKNGDSRFYKSTLEGYFDSNSPDKIENILNEAVSAVGCGNMRTAVDALRNLRGVRLRTASAILTAIYPDIFTIMDILALRALNVEDTKAIDDPPSSVYMRYNEFCRETAKEYGVSLRILDRALWHWGRKNP
jgi:thermostable 8-oxoguanine DNA glycosylase